MKENQPRDPSLERIHDLYTECMNCSNTVEQCPGIWKDIRGGVPPRGFHYQRAPVKVLAVAKNPGHPLKGEKKLYSGLDRRELLQAYRDFQATFYPNPDKYAELSNRFHKNLFRYLAFFLDVPHSDIYQHAAHTNIVKCSTPKESAKLNSKTMEECFQKYFLREIELFQPKVLLALGRESEAFLLKKSWKLCLPIIYVRHPSYYYPKEKEHIILDRIKEDIQFYL